MGPASYAWREVCASALRESDPKELAARIERAMAAIERRYAEWPSNPGTPDEMRLIRKTISGLKRLLQESVLTNRSVGVRNSAARTSAPAVKAIATKLDGNIKRLVVLRSPSVYGKQNIHKSSEYDDETGTRPRRKSSPP